MRKPSLDKPPKLDLKKGETITQIRVYKVITPLFGGGVTPGETDPVTPIRGTEIRGHLRFWWRATRGGKFKTVKAMKEAEDELWGAASIAKDPKVGPSQVKVAVEIVAEGTDDNPFEVIRNPKGGKAKIQPRSQSVVPPYAAFPLQPTQEEAEPGMKTKAVRANVAFNLTISYPAEKAADIDAALWAWETFGGVGARTRRGFGALQCVKINGKVEPPPMSNQVDKFIKKMIEMHVVKGQWPEGTPALSLNGKVRLKVIPHKGNVVTVWKRLINTLRKFRQHRGKRGFGASHWPEPDAIRSFTQGKTPENRPLIKKFPRARFGLPIVFHFPQRGQPQDATLQGGEEQERLASPLILRPLACEQGSVGVALILQTPLEPPNGLILKAQDREKPFQVEASLTKKEAQNIQPLQGKTDVLQAFLDTL